MGLGDTNGLVQADINDRVYMCVIDDAEAGPNDRIFVIPPATYTLETFEAALQAVLRVDYPDWTVGDTITTPGLRMIIPSLGEITNLPGTMHSGAVQYMIRWTLVA